MEAPNFKSLRNIDTSFSLMRLFMLVVIIGCLGFSSAISFWAFDAVEKSRQKVYVMDGGKSIMLAMAQEHNINRPAEARDHIRVFLKAFFELEPDENQIKNTIKEASYLGDESVGRLYKDLSEKGYYQNLIQGNVHQKVEIDKNNIIVDFTQSPYKFRAKGREMLIRETTVTIRNLVVEGYLIDVARTDNNPHGFQIERFLPVDNTDIETVNRNNQSTY